MKKEESRSILHTSSNDLNNRMGKSLLLFLLLLAGLLRFRFPDEAFEALIVPDGVEYAVSAVNLLEGKGYSLFMDGKVFPPRAPFGYSLTLIPFYVLFGKALGTGIFSTLCFGLASVALLFFIARKLFGERSALWAALFLTISPLHLYWSRQIMADIPSSFMALGCLWFFFKGEMTFRRAFLLGLLLGVSCWIKYANVLFTIPYLFLLFRRETSLKERTMEGLFFLGGLGFVSLPLFLYHHFAFGAPLATGFSFWTPEWVRLENTFSFRYAFHEPRFPVGGAPNTLALAKMLLGMVSPWHQNPHLFFLTPFIGIGAWRILKSGRPQEKSFLLFSAVAVGIFYIFFSFYFAQNPRTFLPVIPLLLVLGGVGFNHNFSRFPLFLQRGGVIFIAGTFLVGIAVLRPSDESGSVRKEYSQLVLDETEKDSHIITGWDPVLFYHEIQKNSPRRYLPLSEWVEYVHQPFRPLPQREIPFLIPTRESSSFEEVVLSQRSVTIDEVSCRLYPEECGLLKKKFLFRKIASKGEVVLYRIIFAQGR